MIENESEGSVSHCWSLLNRSKPLCQTWFPQMSLISLTPRYWQTRSWQSKKVNTRTSLPIKGQKNKWRHQVSSVCFFLWGHLLSFWLHDNGRFSLSCQNPQDIVWLSTQPWFCLLFSIEADGAWSKSHFLSLACPLKGCKMGLFWDFLEIATLTDDLNNISTVTS